MSGGSPSAHRGVDVVGPARCRVHRRAPPGRQRPAGRRISGRQRRDTRIGQCAAAARRSVAAKTGSLSSVACARLASICNARAASTAPPPAGPVGGGPLATIAGEGLSLGLCGDGRVSVQRHCRASFGGAVGAAEAVGPGTTKRYGREEQSKAFNGAVRRRRRCRGSGARFGHSDAAPSSCS